MWPAAASGDTSSRRSAVWRFRASRDCSNSGSLKAVAVFHKPSACTHREAGLIRAIRFELARHPVSERGTDAYSDLRHHARHVRTDRPRRVRLLSERRHRPAKEGGTVFWIGGGFSRWMLWTVIFLAL